MSSRARCVCHSPEGRDEVEHESIYFSICFTKSTRSAEDVKKKRIERQRYLANKCGIKRDLNGVTCRESRSLLCNEIHTLWRVPQHIAVVSYTRSESMLFEEAAKRENVHLIKQFFRFIFTYETLRV